MIDWERCQVGPGSNIAEPSKGMAREGLGFNPADALDNIVVLIGEEDPKSAFHEATSSHCCDWPHAFGH